MENSTPATGKNSDVSGDLLKQIVMGTILLAAMVYVTYGMLSKKNMNEPAQLTALAGRQELQPQPPPKRIKHPSHPQSAVGKKSAVVKPKPESLHRTSRVVERAKVPTKKIKVANISGKWRTDENERWEITQSGSDVNITFYDKKDNILGSATTGIVDNEISFVLKKRGRDKKGAFKISDDGTSMQGSLSKRIGDNIISVTRIE